jgi:phosphate transport system substrate-binding protein
MNQNLIFKLSLLGLILFSCNKANENKLKIASEDESKLKLNISGSTTMAPFFDLFISENNLATKTYAIQIKENGSNEGVKEMLWNINDIAMSSNRMSTHELDSLKALNINIGELNVAIDAVVIIVNYKNKVKRLTSDQIKGIFSGDITNWSEVGGHNQLINIISRDKNSGTYSYVVSHLLKDNHVTNNAKFLNKNSEILDLVSTDANSISYTSLLHTDKVDKIAIAFDEGGKYIKPTVENVLNHKYRLHRGLYLYYKLENLSKIKILLDFIKNGAMNQAINSSGFIPSSLNLQESESNSY